MVNELLTYAILLDSLILAYIQLMIILTELQKVLKCLCSRMNHTKNYGCLFHFYCIRNKHIV